MKAEEIAQYIVDNRHSKSEFEKVSDSELYHFIVDSVKELEQQKQSDIDELVEFIKDINSRTSNMYLKTKALELIQKHTKK